MDIFLNWGFQYGNNLTSLDIEMEDHTLDLMTVDYGTLSGVVDGFEDMRDDAKDKGDLEKLQLLVDYLLSTTNEEIHGLGVSGAAMKCDFLYHGENLSGLTTPEFDRLLLAIREVVNPEGPELTDAYMVEVKSQVKVTPPVYD